MTANDRFKATAKRRVRWAAVTATIAVHAALLFLTPSWDVFSRGLPGLGPRMVVEVGPWAQPPDLEGTDAVTPFGPGLREPVFLNPGEVNRLVLKRYPPMLWRHREEGSAVFLLQLNRSGRVVHAEILESSGNGTESALLAIARTMRFEIDTAHRSGLVGVVEIGVLQPR